MKTAFVTIICTIQFKKSGSTNKSDIIIDTSEKTSFKNKWIDEDLYYYYSNLIHHHLSWNYSKKIMTQFLLKMNEIINSL